MAKKGSPNSQKKKKLVKAARLLKVKLTDNMEKSDFLFLNVAAKARKCKTEPAV